MPTWLGDSKNMEEIEFWRWLFEGRPRQGKNVLPDGLNWLCYFAGSSKSHRENSISCIFLESPHQVDMKNVVKCYKHFFCYFNALKTHRDYIVMYDFRQAVLLAQYHGMFLSGEIAQKAFPAFDNIFHVYLMRGFQKYGRNWILTVAFWGQTKAGQKCAARWAELAVLFCR